MSRRSKRKEETPSTPKPAKVPEKLASPFASAMKAMKAELAAQAEEAKERAARGEPPPRPVVAPAPPRTAPKKPSDPISGYGYDDRAAFHQAFAGVRPLPAARTLRRSGQTGPISAAERSERAAVAARVDAAEADARARLEALVAGAARFVIERNDDEVYGRRTDVADRVLDALCRAKSAPATKVDLHGLDAKAAFAEVARSLREHAARGVRELLIVHGKGLHSEGGQGVLGEVVVKALTESAAAPRVAAFASAPLRFGGSGALLVRLG